MLHWASPPVTIRFDVHVRDELFRAKRWQGFRQDLLNAVAADCFANVYGALRIDRHHVQETEESRIVSEAAESRDGLARVSGRQCNGMIERPQDLVLAVRDERPGLRRVLGEIDVPRRAGAFLA